MYINVLRLIEQRQLREQTWSIPYTEMVRAWSRRHRHGEESMTSVPCRKKTKFLPLCDLGMHWRCVCFGWRWVGDNPFYLPGPGHGNKEARPAPVQSKNYGCAVLWTRKDTFFTTSKIKSWEKIPGKAGRLAWEQVHLWGKERWLLSWRVQGEEFQPRPGSVLGNVPYVFFHTVIPFIK